MNVTYEGQDRQTFLGIWSAANFLYDSFQRRVHLHETVQKNPLNKYVKKPIIQSLTYILLFKSRIKSNQSTN